MGGAIAAETPTWPDHSRGAHGERIVTVADTTTEVRITFYTEPPERITDPHLQQLGVQAYRAVVGQPNVQEGDAERLYPEFRVRPARFFTVGRVFEVLWVEPAGTTVITTANPCCSFMQTTDNRS